MQLHPHQPIISNTQQFVLALRSESDYEKRDPILGKRLPGFDVIQFGLDQR